MTLNSECGGAQNAPRPDHKASTSSALTAKFGRKTALDRAACIALPARDGHGIESRGGPHSSGDGGADAGPDASRDLGEDRRPALAGTRSPMRIGSGEMRRRLDVGPLFDRRKGSDVEALDQTGATGASRARRGALSGLDVPAPRREQDLRRAATEPPAPAG